MRKPLPGPAGDPVEVADLRARVAELEAEREQFRQFADESASMMYLYDLDDERIVYANRRYEELLGYAPDELTAPGFDFRVLVAPDSQERVRRSHELHLAGEEHLPFEFTMLAKDGRAVDVMLATRLVRCGGHRCVAGLAADISAQHRSAALLSGALDRADREQARAESIIAALGDSIVVQDRGYRVTYQNEVNRNLFGEHLGELCHQAYEGLDHVCPGCPVELTFRDGQVHRLVHTAPQAGRTITVELVSSPLRDASGRVVAGLKLVRDITAQVEAAEQLRVATEELERQNVQLRALDRVKDGLVRDVSHELKTPVAKLAMQLEILRALLGPACTGPVESTLESLEATVRRQQRVIRDLLDLARLESGRRVYRLEAVRLDETLVRVLEDYRPMLEAAGFAVTLRVEPVAVTADGEMLWHVRSNLVNNAIKFAAGEGQRRLKLAAAREGGRGVARVADNGVGLAPEELARAFDRFYQASASVEGSGVGLSICRSIMEGMAGTVTLDSPGRGGGAVGTVSLPLA